MVALLYVFVAAFFSDNKSHKTMPVQRVTVSEMLPGENLLVKWVGAGQSVRPVLIHRRTPAEIAALNEVDGPRTVGPQLVDPDSAQSRQPAWAKNAWRSRSPEWFVAIAVGTDLGCSIRFKATDGNQFKSYEWSGGYIDQCRGSRYDLSGRVYAAQYAETNLIVPEYTLLPGLIVLGGQKTDH